MIGRSGLRAGFAITAICIAAACTDTAPTTDTAPAQPIPQVEYDVISAAVRAIVEREPFAGPTKSEADGPVRMVVILAIPDPEGARYLRPIPPDSGPPMDPTTLEDYAAKWSRGSFEERFTGIGPYRLMPVAEQAMEGGFREFYRRHPGAPGFLAFSRVGVSSNGREAIVHVLHLWDAGAGYVDALLFRRRGDTWYLAGRQRLEDI